MTPTEEIFTVAECVEVCGPDIRVKIIGKNKDSESPILQLITKGEYLDCVKSADGVIKYRCTAIVVRLAPYALNEWIFSEPSDSKDFFETAEEYEKYLADTEKARDDLYRSIIKALNIEDKGVKITQNESEIFTVTQILPLPLE